MENNSFPILLKNVSFYYEENKHIFKDLNIELPGGVVSLIGQNGTGKTTFLLLAAGRIIPQVGTVNILGTETYSINNEIEKNKLVSFVYQNMEFETEELIGELLTEIYENGFHKKKDPQLINTIIEIMDLSQILNKKTGEISKGELQRTILAFSLLYGSKIIMMDEPVFALENYRKEIIFNYLNEFAKQFNVSIYFSIHELDLSKRYSENILLFTKDGKILSGLTKELLKKEIIENAFQVPIDMLYQRENLFRDHLLNKNIDNLKGLNTKIIE